MNHTCKAEGCDRVVAARGLCRRHYARLYRTGQLEARLWQPKSQCTVEGCERDSEARGYCTLHRSRMRTHGDPGAAEPLQQRRAATAKKPCSAEGCGRPRKGSTYCHLHNERLRRTGEVGPAQPTRARGVVKPRKEDGYIRLTLPDGRRVLEHVHVKEQELGRRLVPPENVHHKNGIGHDNAPGNLELWLKMQPSGQRVQDLMEYIAEYHADAMLALLAARKA